MLCGYVDWVQLTICGWRIYDVHLPFGLCAMPPRASAVGGDVWYFVLVLCHTMAPAFVNFMYQTFAAAHSTATRLTHLFAHTQHG